MIVIIDKTKFFKAINIAESVISTKELRHMLSNILLRTKGNELELIATDLEIGIRMGLEAQVEVQGSIAVPAKKFSQAIREFRGNTIRMSVGEDEKVTITDVSGITKASIRIMGTSADEFPPMPVPESNDYVPFPSGTLIEMIRKTSYASAEEDARYVFNGLYFISKEKTLTVVATDGRRLAKIDRVMDNDLPFTSGVILPNKAVKELLRLLDAGTESSVAFDQADKKLFFRIGEINLICKLIDGQFPDYNVVIPQRLEYTVDINGAGFGNAIRQVAVMAAEPTRQIRLQFGSDTLSIKASTPDLGEAEDGVPVNFTGPETTIAFNSNYLLDILRIIETEDVKFGFSSPSSPAVIMDPKDEAFRSVIMPMKL